MSVLQGTLRVHDKIVQAQLKLLRCWDTHPDTRHPRARLTIVGYGVIHSLILEDNELVLLYLLQ